MKSLSASRGFLDAPAVGRAKRESAINQLVTDMSVQDFVNYLKKLIRKKK